METQLSDAGSSGPDPRIETEPRIRDGDLFSGFESVPLFTGQNVVAGRTRISRDSSFWQDPSSSDWPRTGVVFVFPRYPYSIRRDDGPLVVVPHDVRVVRPGDSAFRADSECRYEVENLWIHVTEARLAADRADHVDPLGGDAPLSATTFALQRLLVAGLEGGSLRGSLPVEKTISKIVGSLSSFQPIASQSRRAQTEEFRREAVSRAKLFMAERFTEKLSVPDVARAAGLSRSHFCEVFREHTGNSIHRFIHDLRLREASWRLPHYRRRIGELGIELGFNSASHFTTAFRRRFSESPLSFLARLRAACDSFAEPTTPT